MKLRRLGPVSTSLGGIRAGLYLYLFPIVCALSFAGPTRGQQSYVAQRVSGGSNPALPIQKQTQKPARHGSAAHFAGWIKAQHDGPEIFEKFAELRARKPWKVRANPNAGPAGAAANGPGGPAASGQAAGTIPGIVTRPSLPAGAIPTAVVSGDFNGDGKADWVVANGGDNSLYIYFGNGDGTAQLPVILRLTGRSPTALAAADLRGSGHLDLIVAEGDTQSVGILLGNGDGTFAAEEEVPLPNSTPLSLAVADLNKDGKLDLVVGIIVESFSSIAQVSPFCVLLGNGSGGFGAPIFAPNGNGIIDQYGYSESVADVNGDGIPDVLTTGPDLSGGSSQIYLGKGDGTFTAGQALQFGAAPFYYVDSGLLADMNGDGCPDGVVTDNAGVIRIYLGNCQGTFDRTNVQPYGMGDAIFGVSVADVNGDGLPDLIAGGYPSTFGAADGDGTVAGNLLGVRLSTGKGQWGPLSVYAGDPGMYSLAVVDLLGNGYPEVVTVNQDFNSVTVYQNDGTGGFGTPRGGYTGYYDGRGVASPNPAASEFLLADVNGDGKQDIFQLQYPSGGTQAPPYFIAAVLLNQGNGNFATAVRSETFNTLAFPIDFVLANFRNTGALDLLAEINDISGNAPIQELAFAPNLGGGQFGTVNLIQGPPIVSGTVSSGLGVGDFNKDGKLDFVIVTQGGAEGNEFGVEMFLGNGDGTFQQSTQMLTGVAPTGNELGQPLFPAPVYVEDANSDGNLDLLVWFAVAGEVVEFLGNGDGTFQAPTNILQNVQGLAVRDLNNDGRLDLVQLGGAPSPAGELTAVDIYLGQANGNFSGPTTYAPYAGVPADFFTTQYKNGSVSLFSQMIGDFNGDGNQDIAVFQKGQQSERYVQFLSGNGDGTFYPNYDIFTLGEQDIPVLAVANLTGDGRTVFLHEDDFGATYHIVETSPGTPFQIDMDETPVLGSQDALHISLNTVSTSDTAFQLSASDPGVQISATATIPAGQASADVPFTLAAGFNTAKMFSITAQSGTNSQTAYNFVSSPSVPSGFSALLLDKTSNSSTVTAARGSTSDGVAIIISSQGEATATFQPVGCVGLPAEATCAFQPDSLFVPPGAFSMFNMVISTTSSIAMGSYPFSVQITDGVETFTLSGTLNVGDFTLSLSPSSQTVAEPGVATYTYTIGSIANYELLVALTCTLLPSGTSCLQGSGYPGSSGQVQVSLNQVAPGNYTITLSGTSDMVTHTASAQLQVIAAPQISLSQSQVNFPQILLGASNSIQINLQNSGSAPLSIQSIAASTTQGPSGAFGQTNNCGASVAVGAMCQVNATFMPTAIGNASGSIQLSDNAGGSPQSIPLTGAGVDFSFGAASGSSTSATISPGQTATYSLQVQPNQFLGAITLNCSGAPSEATCLVPQTVAISNTGNLTFEVQLLTTAPSGVPPLALEDGAEKLLTRKPSILLLFCFGLLTYVAWKQRRLRRLAALLAILAAVLLTRGCGGGATGGTGTGPLNLGTPAGSYQLTITGQGGGGTRTINLTLIVH